MANNAHPTSGAPRVTSDRTDTLAWERARVLSHALTEAKERLAAATASHQPESRIRRLRRKVEDCGSEIFVANRGLAGELANRYAKRANAADTDDIRAVADEALWNAILSWDPDMSPLGSWARRMILKALNTHVARMELGMSNWSYDKRPAVLEAARRLEADRRPVTAETVAAIADVTVETADLILSARAKTLSLDVNVGDDDGTTTLGATIADAVELADVGILDAAHDTIAEMTWHLDIVELFVWLRSTGVDGAEAWTSTDMESVFGVSAETVRRITRRAEQQILDGPPEVTSDAELVLPGI
jgi:hypothetical protein